jgi:hypothetical protein
VSERQKSNEPSPAALQRDPHVLEQGEMREDGGDLKGPHEPEPRDLGGPRARDVAPVVADAPARRREEVREQVEAGGLAAPLGPISA